MTVDKPFIKRTLRSGEHSNSDANLATGTYVLKVIQNNHKSKTFKSIKK